MLDPELCFGILDERLDHLSALRSLLLVEVETGNDFQCELFGIVIQVARQKNPSGPGQLQEQGSWPASGTGIDGRVYGRA